MRCCNRSFKPTHFCWLLLPPVSRQAAGKQVHREHQSSTMADHRLAAEMSISCALKRLHALEGEQSVAKQCMVLARMSVRRCYRSTLADEAERSREPEEGALASCRRTRLA